MRPFINTCCALRAALPLGLGLRAPRPAAAAGGPLQTPVTTVQFSTYSYTVGEGCVQTDLAVTRSGPKDGTTVVSFSVTQDGPARQRGDYTRMEGTLTFAPGEETKFVPVLISEDAYAEGLEWCHVYLRVVQGGRLGSEHPARLHIADNDATDGTSNPIDDNATFVGQHYHDFLSRQADPGSLAFWTNELDACNGDPGCLDRKRADVSAAFFLSIEFQRTGYFVIRVDLVAFDHDVTWSRYEPFLCETQNIGQGVFVGQPNWEQTLEARRQLYVEKYVARSGFQSVHGRQNAEQYVDSLFSNPGVTPTQSERAAALSASGAGGLAGQAAALRSVVESGSVYNKLYNTAFVLMQYFAYLRRSPDIRPDNSLDGYNYWLSKLDRFTLPGEDVRDESVALSRVRRAEMVRAFLLSDEYRGRFQGDPNRGNQLKPVHKSAGDPNPSRSAVAASTRPALSSARRWSRSRAAPASGSSCSASNESKRLREEAAARVARGGFALC